MRAKLPAMPWPVTRPIPRADLLDRRHQRAGEQHDPAHRVAELRAGLRIGGDAAGIVVGGAGDQPAGPSTCSSLGLLGADGRAADLLWNADLFRPDATAPHSLVAVA